MRTRLIGACLAAVAAMLMVAASAGAASYAKGLDVSHWQGSIDWLQVAGDGNSFLFAKATEGTTITDVTYAVNRAGAGGVGLRLGAYHFARPAGSGAAGLTANAIAQADYFVGVAQPKGGDLPPALDLETKGTLNAADLVTWTQAWLDEVTARTGLHAVVYASPNFWKTSLGDTPVFAGAGNRLWIAHWTANAAPLVPASNWGGLGWTFWQWTDCSAVPGFAHCVDGDRANGASPIPFAVPPLPSGAPTPNTPPTITGTAKVGTQLAGVPGTWSGGKPVGFSYQWSSCDAAGAGCTPIPGATLETYKPTSLDAGHALTLSVTAASSSGTAVGTSPATIPVAASGSTGATRPAVLTAPAVSGTAEVGQTLTSASGTWSGSPTSFAFQWQRCDAAGAGCAAIAGATGSSYTVTPADIGLTVSLIVTATGAGGSQSATAPTSAVVIPAPVPAAVPGSLAAQPGLAGAVVTTDARATATWQPGVVPTGTTLALTPEDTLPSIAGTGLSLTLDPASPAPLPWPVDIAYAAAPPGQVVGFSTDGKVWTAVAALTSPALAGDLAQGVYTQGTTLHILTRVAGHFALFRAGRWGDPQRVSPTAPVIRRQTDLKVTHQADGSLLLVTRLSTSSQTHLYASIVTGHTSILKTGSRLGIPLGGGSSRTAQVLLLNSGGFPVRLRLSARGLPHRALVQIRLKALDPWGRTGTFTLSFRTP